MRKLFLFAALIIALVMVGAVSASEPGDLPTPPVGYSYLSQTANQTVFTQSLGAEAIANNSFSTWAADNPSSWTVAGENGTTRYVTETAADGTTGTGAAHFVSDGAISLNVNAVGLTNGTMYEAALNVSQYSSGTFQWISGGVASSVYSSGGTYYSLYRDLYNQFAIGALTGSTSNFTIDTVSARPITINSTQTGTADGTHTFYFTLPATPYPGQRVEMRYRVGDTVNYWVAFLTRNTSSNWNFTLQKIVAGAYTTLITVNNVGTSVDAIRVMSVGNNHTAYTGVAGTYTQRGTTQTDSALASNTGLLAVYSSAVPPSALTSWAIGIPIPTDTPTATPLPATDTPTITPTPTATPTPNLYVYWTLEPSGQPVRMYYRVTPADTARTALLVGVLLSIWAILLLSLFVFRRKSDA